MLVAQRNIYFLIYFDAKIKMGKYLDIVPIVQLLNESEREHLI